MAVTTGTGSVFYGRLDGGRLGYSVASAGDIDGDGFGDLIFGAPRATERSATGELIAISSGEAIVLSGGPGGFAPVVDLAAPPPELDMSVLQGTERFADFGTAVAGGGDLDGDGLDDLLIGEPYADGLGGSDSGRTYILYGDGGLPGDWVSGVPGGDTVVQEVEGNALNTFSGFAVAVVGDINGDGLIDAAHGAPGSSFGTRFGNGKVEVMLSGRLDRDFDGGDGSSGRLVVEGAGALDFAGFAIGAAGDFNSDGIDDFILGAPGADLAGTDAGAAYLVFGRRDGWAGSLDLATASPSDALILAGAGPGDETGRIVGLAGDVNGDGQDDVLVGGWGPSGAGAIYVVYGGTVPAGGRIDLTTLDGTNGFRIEGSGDSMSFGVSAAGVGDVNDDGFDDILIGAPGLNVDGKLAPGGAYLIFGAADRADPVVNATAMEPGSGYRFDGVRSYDNAGIAVASAGDIDGDGRSDMLIGADAANSGGLVDNGAVYLVRSGAPILAALDALDGTSDGTIDLANVGRSVQLSAPLPPAEETPADDGATPPPGPLETVDPSLPLLATEERLGAWREDTAGVEGAYGALVSGDSFLFRPSPGAEIKAEGTAAKNIGSGGSETANVLLEAWRGMGDLPDPSLDSIDLLGGGRRNEMGREAGTDDDLRVFEEVHTFGLDWVLDAL